MEDGRMPRNPAAMLSYAPPQLLGAGSSDDKGENARLSSFVGALAITDLMKTTLGPKGMDKILVAASSHFGELTVTNDGATILKSIQVDNPSARVLIEISKTQDAEVGDGTTSVCVLAGELIREAEQLINSHIHPQTIIDGWRTALEICRKRLHEIAEDNSSDETKFKEDLLNIARTTLSSKILSTDKELFAKIAVDAVLRLKGNPNLDAISIIKTPGGSFHDSYLDEGFIIEKKIGAGQPKRLENPKIIVVNTGMDADRIKFFGARIRMTDMEKIGEIDLAERERMREKCKKVLSHGVNCVINRQLIYGIAEEFFTDNGIMAIEHVDFDGVERIALILGAEIVSSFDRPDLVKLGTCKVIEEILIGEDRYIKFSGVPVGEACTIVLRGASTHLIEEADRSIHDALCVVSQTVNAKKIVFGGGCVEVELAQAVDEIASKTPGKKALALEAFARALRKIPIILADNGGYDSSDLISQLRAAHSSGNIHAGINMYSGTIGNMKELGVTESLRVKEQVLLSAEEAAEQILRVDEIIRAPKRKREKRPRHH